MRRGKRILITAGPTWVPIDSVRVIGNIATGETGVLLAKEAAAGGAKVTLILGPCPECGLNNSIRTIRFSFFKQLKDILSRELKKNKYDAIIHSAAVSDFKLKYKAAGKLSSDKAHSLQLVPLEKLVALIRRLNQKARLVMFKLEPGVTDKILLNRAKRAGIRSGADLIVANRLNPYRAFIIDRDNGKIAASSKKDLAKKLIKILGTAPLQGQKLYAKK